MRLGGKLARRLVVGVAAVVTPLAAVSLPAPGSDARGEQSKAFRSGPLRVLRANPRYFADASGRPVYLTGSHVWWNVATDESWGCDGREAAPFDFDAHLDRLKRHGHNFIRLWRLELIRWKECDGELVSVPRQPWQRTGPGLAADGLPRFDLTLFDERYFERLRDRVVAARRRGFYVSVMLFEGWSPRLQEDGWGARGHPFAAENNVNGIAADRNGDGRANEVHTLLNPRITAIQDAYVRKVVDTVHRYDNVLYEVANEPHKRATRWQYRLIRLIRTYERRRGTRHPIGMTYQHGDHADTALRRSRADWISPFAGGPAALENPPPADGRKVVLLDTDHLCGVCGEADFVWKSMTRGHNPIFMDPLDADPGRESIRQAMGWARRYANRLDLRRAHPRPELASTGFALVRPGVEYLVYQPERRRFWVDLEDERRRYSVEWFDPRRGKAVRRGRRSGAGRVTFTAPWRGPAVLLLERARG